MGATFTQDAVFNGATFTQDAVFTGATFTQNAEFSVATFAKEALFIATTFTEKAYFGAKFRETADFGRAKFTKEAYFNDATFTQLAFFPLAMFAHEADFSNATFAADADFYQTTFESDAIFQEATFSHDLYFHQTLFKELVVFSYATFFEVVEFRETKFRGWDQDEKGRAKDLIPGPNFSLAQFSKPEKVLFYKTYLGQALFHNCDVSKFVLSSVEWRQRKRTAKSKVLEEDVDLDFTPALKGKKGGREFVLIAELYQQLKKNYDDKRDYWTAGEFHYGEMEMKRLASRSEKRPPRWLHRNLGLVAWYKYASEYGESYVRPGISLAIVLAVFTFLFPLAGLDLDGSGTRATTELSYRQFADFVNSYSSGKWAGRAAFFGHSLMTTLSVPGFQKELKYEPSYPWGRALALFELLLTSTLIALFLLAVRRQFRR